MHSKVWSHHHQHCASVRRAVALVLSGFFALDTVAVFGQVSGDFRTKASGNWSDASTWESYNGTNWADAVSVPGSLVSVWIQSGHAVTLTTNEACADFNFCKGVTGNTSPGSVALDSFTLSISGQLRAYNGAVGTIPGTPSSGNLGAYPFTASSGKVSIVGNSRNLMVAGSWGSGAPTTIGSTVFPLSIDLAAGQIVTQNNGMVVTSCEVKSGTLDVGTQSFRLNTGNPGEGDLTIAYGARLKSSRTGASSPQFGRTTNPGADNRGGTLRVEEGGVLELAGATPTTEMNALVLNGTVQYSNSGAQTLLNRPTGSDPSASVADVYSLLTLSGSGAKSLAMNTTVNGMLTIGGTATTALNLNGFTLSYGSNATLAYAGTAAQIATTNEFPATGVPNLLVSNTSGVTLHGGSKVLNSGGIITVAAGATLNDGTNTLVEASGSVFKYGGGTLDLFATNTYAGGFYINAGTARARNTNALGVGTIYLGDTNGSENASFRGLDSGGGARPLLNDIVVRGGNKGLMMLDGIGGGAQTLHSGALVLDNDVTINGSGGPNAVWRFTGILSGTGNITVSNTAGAGNGGVFFDGSTNDNYRGTVYIRNTYLRIDNSNETLSTNNPVIIYAGATNDMRRSTSIAGLGDDDGVGGTLLNNGPSSRTVTLGGAGTYSFNGVIQDGTSRLSVVKSGAGVQVLGGVNTYSGTTTVNGGTLLVDGAIGTGTVTVAIGATLGGNGEIAGTVVSQGIVNPGNSVGQLDLLNGYTQGVNSALAIDIAGTTPGTGYDVLNVTGDADISAGALQVTLDGYDPVDGDRFTVLTASAVNGPFASLDLPALNAGLGWDVQYPAGSVVLSVTGAMASSGYDLWAVAITNGLTNYTDSATGDGYPNLLKYATGSSPVTPDALARLGLSRSGSSFALVMNRNTDATDVTIVVEGSTSMANDAVWTGIATNQNGVWSPPVSETGAGNSVVATIADPVSGVTNRFLRVTVSKP